MPRIEITFDAIIEAQDLEPNAHIDARVVIDNVRDPQEWMIEAGGGDLTDSLTPAGHQVVQEMVDMKVREYWADMQDAADQERADAYRERDL